MNSHQAAFSLLSQKTLPFWKVRGGPLPPPPLAVAVRGPPPLAVAGEGGPLPPFEAVGLMWDSADSLGEGEAVGSGKRPPNYYPSPQTLTSPANYLPALPLLATITTIPPELLPHPELLAGAK